MQPPAAERRLSREPSADEPKAPIESEPWQMPPAGEPESCWSSGRADRREEGGGGGVEGGREPPGEEGMERRAEGCRGIEGPPTEEPRISGRERERERESGSVASSVPELTDHSGDIMIPGPFQSFEWPSMAGAGCSRIDAPACAGGAPPEPRRASARPRRRRGRLPADSVWAGRALVVMRGAGAATAAAGGRLPWREAAGSSVQPPASHSRRRRGSRIRRCGDRKSVV